MIKKLILSLIIIVGVGASAVLGTQALVSDEVTLTANTFSTGSADLQININKTGGTFGDTQTGFSGTLLPGEMSKHIIRLKNNSDNADLSISAQSINIIPGTGITSNDVLISFTAIDTDTAETPMGTTVTKSLTEWEAIGVLGLPIIEKGKTQRYKMEVKIDEGVTESGTSITFDFIFTGTQAVGPTPTSSP